MLTYAPLPTWSALCRALLRRPASDTDLAAPWRREGEVAGWLSRSAWSLAVTALWRKNRVPASGVTVWIPDFFCNSSLLPLRQTGARLVFYPLTDTLVPDRAACRTLADADSPDLFVLVHYFGQPSACVTVRDFCASHGAWLIEDAAHVLRPVDGVGEYGDFVLYSPHKHVPIPDGAVLVVRTTGPGKFEADALASFGPPADWPGQLRDLQREMGSAANSSRALAMTWFAKRTAQKLGIRRRRGPVVPFAEPANPGLAAAAPLPGASQSGLSRRLVAGLVSDLAAVAHSCQRHQLLWDASLPAEDACGLEGVSIAERPANREWTPYFAAYRAGSATVEAAYDRWQRWGLPVTTWPDLPPEVTLRREHHAHAWHLRHSRLYLPVHQSLNARRIRIGCRVPVAVQRDDSHPTLEWDAATREQWQEWITQAGRSNLVQTWAYGEAKSGHSGWRLKRGVWLSRAHEPIAVVQVLQKRVAGLLRVTRMTRGPVFLGPVLPSEQRAVWEQVARLGCFWRGRALSVAPELRLSGSSLALMADLGFRQFSPYAWESVWVDLELELDVLRRQLDRKWRNLLTRSEKTGLTLEIGSDAVLFHSMVARHEELMQEKHFEGVPAGVLRNLCNHLGDREPLLILRAVHEGEPVAGICVARHGAAATYLIGWNGPKGRQLKANQYLLWQAIVHLRQNGVRWFDLGGISEERTPGITAFKLGLNGERYELVGNYWKW